eukprot:m.154933 g.154933  ORF g.154933 m.154933 type:complete len:178 (+) comp16958_c1_seq82:629-1162(+)
MSFCSAFQKDLDRRETECHSSSQQHKAKFESICKEMGIQGSGNLMAELTALPQELPTIYADITGKLQDAACTAAIDYYAAFVQFSLGAWCDGVHTCISASSMMDVISTLVYFRFHIPTSTFRLSSSSSIFLPLTEGGPVTVCPLLRYIAEHGNSSVYKWKTVSAVKEKKREFMRLWL